MSHSAVLIYSRKGINVRVVQLMNDCKRLGCVLSLLGGPMQCD